MAYSKEIKEKVIADLGQGKKAIQISEETGISIPTIQKWKKEAGLVQERKTIEVVPEGTSVVEEKKIERNQQEEQIKDLIRKGFDLELLAFELDIPIEEIKHLEIELQNSQRTDKSTKAKEDRKSVEELDNIAPILAKAAELETQQKIKEAMTVLEEGLKSNPSNEWLLKASYKMAARHG